MAKAIDSDFEEVLNLLECSICLDLCEIPVSMCKNGHNVCDSHIRRLADLSCPVCRVPYSQGLTRNRLAEMMIIKKKEEEKKLKKVNPTGKNGTHLTKAASTPSRPNTSNRNNQSSQQPVTSIRGQSNNRSAYTPSRNTTTGTTGTGAQRNDITTTTTTSLNQFQRLSVTPSRNAHLVPTVGGSRGITCPISFEGCFNREIENELFIDHLKDVHHVKTISEPFAFKNFYVKGDKFVKNGSSKFMIMEAFENSFLVTAHQQDGLIMVWVSLHGFASDSANFSTEIKLISGMERPAGENRINVDLMTLHERILAVTRLPIISTVKNTSCLAITESEVRRRLITSPQNNLKHWRISVLLKQNRIVAPFQPQPRRVVSNITHAGSTSNQNATTHLNRPMSEFARDFYTFCPQNLENGLSDMSSDEDNDIVSAMLTTPGTSSSPPLIDLHDTSARSLSPLNENGIIIHHPPNRPVISAPPRPPLPTRNFLLGPIQPSTNLSSGSSSRNEDIGVQSLLTPTVMESRQLEEQRRINQERLFLQRKQIAKEKADKKADKKDCSIQ